MMRPKVIIVAVVFMFVSDLCAASEDKYYGYLGGCNDAIYVFDFNENVLKLFGVYRLKVNGKEQSQYFIENGILKQIEGNTYSLIIESKKENVTIVVKGNDITGSSPNYGNFWFGICDPAQAKALISEVRNNVN